MSSQRAHFIWQRSYFAFVGLWYVSNNLFKASLPLACCWFLESRLVVQSGLTSAPINPHRVQTIRASSDLKIVSSGKPSNVSMDRYQHRTPFRQ
jgi:hypothetical protein